MTRRIWVVLAALWFFGCGLWAHAATAGSNTGPAHYTIRADVRGMPGSLVLRHCSPEEDSYAKPLKTVDFEHGKLLILRCQRP